MQKHSNSNDRHATFNFVQNNGHGVNIDSMGIGVTEQINSKRANIFFMPVSTSKFVSRSIASTEQENEFSMYWENGHIYISLNDVNL